MANDLTLPDSFSKVPAAFQGAPTENDELGAGVASSYGVIGIKGKVWSIKFGGEEKQLMRDDGDGPRHSIEVVLIKSSPAISKIYYKDGYTDGANQAPDCWSANGITPDASVQNKVSPTCANCPMNAWGSRTTDAGKQAKACADSRRIAVSPLADIDNELTGGPLLLRVPAASLKDLKAYGDLLKSFQYPYFAAATRIAFDPNEAYPKFVFTAIRPLTEEEAAKVIEHRASSHVSTVLAERASTITEGTAAETAKPVPASPFEAKAPVTTEVTKEPAKVETKAPVKPKAAPKVETKVPAETKAATPQEIAAAKLAAIKAELAKAEAEAAVVLEPKVKTPAEIAQEKLIAARKRAAEAVAEAEAEALAAAGEGGGAPSAINDLLSSGGDLGDDDGSAETVESAEEASPSNFDEMLDKLL